MMSLPRASGGGRCVFVLLTSCCSAQQQQQQSPPSILFALADDLGWGNVAWTRNGDSADGEVRTPVMDDLVAQGIELTHAYAWGLCAPSRAAMQSGRHPLHVNVENVDVMNYNPDDPVSGYQGIPLGMVTLPQLLAPAGYRSYFYGKWDVGMATANHTPLGRGYNKSLSYFHHHVDYWTGVYPQQDSGPIGYFPECLAISPELGAGFRPVDLWEHRADGSEGPAVGRLSDRYECDSSVGGTGTWVPEWCLGVSAEAEAACPAYPVREDCKYIDDVFAIEAAATITAHAAVPDPGPFMLIFAAHGVHAPLQLPRSRLDQVPIHEEYPDWRRRRYAGMVTQFDEHVGLLRDAMVDGGWWENGLIVMSSDNGGPLYNNGAPGASNWPLRGGKGSNWEGGIRVPSFVSGGVVPDRARGTQRDGLVTLWDWYATWASLAGVDANDPAAEAAAVEHGLPPVGADSVDQWAYLTGDVATPPRRSIALGGTTGTFFATKGHFGGDAYTSGMLFDERDANGVGPLWKVLTRKQLWSGWGGRIFPNASTAADPAPFVGFDCGELGCLFDINADEAETMDVSEEEPEKRNELLALITTPNRGMEDPNACITALAKYDTFWGPWLPHSVDLPFVPTPSALLVPTVSYIDSFWHPPRGQTPPPPSNEAQGAKDSRWIHKATLVCAMAFVVVICLGVGRRLTTGALLKPKAGVEELIEMKQVETS